MASVGDAIIGHAARFSVEDKKGNDKFENWKVTHPLNSYHILIKASAFPH
jgi:hypothetical protein